MDYTYPDSYGSHIVEKRYDAGTRKYYTFQQDKVDASVDKALLQGMKETRMSFDKLLAVLRKETVRDMHSDDRWRKTAYDCLEVYTGGVTLHGDVLVQLPPAGKRYQPDYPAVPVGTLADYWTYLLGKDITADAVADA